MQTLFNIIRYLFSSGWPGRTLLVIFALYAVFALFFIYSMSKPIWS